ncbi:hypothetical protein F5Y18DRAFT_439424 [Xylariaceae sp. FL1019]|nr:hypothetical protein F5Y18DRAFT_439424 [Xylariaceae sp. FL1019]
MKFPIIVVSLTAAKTNVFAAPNNPGKTLATSIRPTMTSSAQGHVDATISQSPVLWAQGDQYVITLVNSHTAPVETHHVVNRNQVLVEGPAAIHDSAGVIEVFGERIITVPQGWAGNIAIAEEGWMTRDSNSLLEGSFVVQAGSQFPQITLDVSYVDGFTVPITCICADQVLLGCNLDLNYRCPAEHRITEKACRNPNRELPPEQRESFMSECAGMAYTYPADDMATINGIAGCNNRILCCIGTACKPHPRQKVCPNWKGGEMPCSSSEIMQSSEVIQSFEAIQGCHPVV